MPAPTADEIERRVEETDTARSARRAAAARQVGALAQRHAALSEQLRDLERQLGDALVDAEDIASLSELARFTDVPVADLTRWRTGHKKTRVRRKKPTPTPAPVDSEGRTSPERATSGSA